jgi:hypothetical protein
LLEIVRMLIHSSGGQCQRCAAGRTPWRAGESLFLDLLRAADGGRLSSLLRALFDIKAFQVFVED